MTLDRGCALLASRCASLPALLREAIARPPPALPDELTAARRWVVTATGASEGPARMFAWALRRHAGRCAEFVALSSFAAGAAPGGDALVVFSQELSPNARLGLASRGAYAHTVLVTATPDHPDVRAAALDGTVVCAHPPSQEPSLLLRVLGPAAATVVALRLAERVAGAPGSIVPPPLWEAVPAAVERAFGETLGDAAARPLDGPLALVTAPDGADAAHGLRWKWLEGAGTCDPPCWDVLQFAHGPWQHVVDRPFTLVALEPAHPPTRALFDRLGSMLDPARHALVRLRAELASPASFFEHDARMNALVCATHARLARDLVRWPGLGADGPLYNLGK